MKRFTQDVLVEFRNSTPFVDKWQSDKEITIERICKFYEIEQGFSENRDSLTFVDSDSYRDDLDEWEKDQTEQEDE